MPAEFSVDKRDIQFVLYEQLRIDQLCKLSAYQECNRELFEMIVDEAIKVATEVLAPLNATGDREGLHFENGEVRTPRGFKQIFRKYAQGGWIGMTQQPAYGGQGLPHVLKFAAVEIFAGANVALFLTSLLTEGAAHLIEKFGSQELKNTYCEKLYTGQWTGTMCLTEPAAGSDVGSLKTTAKKNKDHYLISGSKIFITSGEHDLTPNIVHQVLARIEGSPPGTKGISLFCVPKYIPKPDGTLGERNDVVCGNIEHKMGIHASSTCTMNFGEEGKCKGWLLGEANTGMRLMFQMMNEARLGVGLQGLGLASAAYLNAQAYAKERTQGDSLKAPRGPTAPRALIIEHPDVRRMLLRMKSLVDGMRSLMYTVAWYIDLAEHAQSAKQRKLHRNYVELLTPICKAYGSDMGFRVNEIAIQVYGGYGYCQEYPVEQYLRDQKISSIYEGTNGIQAIDLMCRKVAGKGGLLFMQYLELVNAFVKKNQQHPELGEMVAALSRAKDELVRVTRRFLAMIQKDPAVPLLHACPYLEMFGHVAMAICLLEGATKASARLSEIYDRQGAMDKPSQARLLLENSQAAFYHGRIASTRYFVHHILPEVYALSSGMLSEDRSALEVVFSK